MTYTKDDNTWLLIRANTGYWFSKNTLAFFGSKIYWNTLTPVEGGYLFISSEDNFDGTERLFSVRKVNRDFGIETPEWQTLPDLKAAKTRLRELVADSHTCFMEGQGDGRAACKCGRAIRVLSIEARPITQKEEIN